MSAKIYEKSLYKLANGFFVLCFLLFGAQAVDAASLNLAWNANTETDLAGYRIYYGTSSGNYSASKETGKITSYTLSNLNEGTTYYIAMSAFDTSLNESQKSTETTGVARGAEQCADGVDNDGDGLVDCSDPECANLSCNDNNLCTSNDRCVNLQCQGILISCDDGNVCTTDSCNPASGCAYTNNTASCNDGLYCNGSDTCSGGSCSVHAGNPCSGGPVCNNTCNEAADNCFAPGGTACTDDSNVCTNDICSGSGSCVHPNNTASCNDGNACTTGDICSGGTCVGGPALSCDDGNVCTTDSCNPASGCAHPNNTASCNDGNACTTGDICSGGTCVGGPALSCDDGRICTSDSCNPQLGCVYTAISGCCSQDSACTDNNLCTGIERCDAVTGSCIPGTPPVCDDGNSCTDDSCDPLMGCVPHNNSAPCDDGLFCNGYDTCGDGSCSIHSGDPCKALTCNEEIDICEDVGIVCDNPDACSSYSGMWSITTSDDAFAGTARTSTKNVTHIWMPELPQNGFYDVSMWWSAHPKGCKNCPVEIVCNGESVGALSVNQQLKGGQWNLLGTYALDEGSTCSVILKSEGLNKRTCADAVKLVYRGENLPEAQIISISPNPADVGEEVYFAGTGTSPSGKSIISYSWISDRDGEIGSSDLLYVSSLSEGKHQISFSVQDEEGVWSLPAGTTLYIGTVEITCDNGEACTSFSERWKQLSRTDAFGGTSMVSSKTGTYTWGPYLPVAGYYEVYMWWSSLLSSCSSCPVTITCGGEMLDTVAVNQKVGSSQWNLLGSYELAQGTTCEVTLTSPGSYSTIADAVKFVLTDNLPNAHILFSH